MSSIPLSEFQAFLYPLGWLASFLFGCRFFVQWIASERRGKSVLPPLFLWISLMAHLLMIFHACIQMQGGIILGQAVQLILNMRQMELQQVLRPRIKTPFNTVLLLLLLVGCLGGGIFGSSFFLEDSVWLRAPLVWSLKEKITDTDRMIGLIGLFFFYIRFFPLWILREGSPLSDPEEVTTIGSYFWMVSILGSLLSGYYFVIAGDPVNCIGVIPGLLIYARNYVLGKRELRLTTSYTQIS